MVSADLDSRPCWDDEEFAIYAMRLIGALGPQELPSPEDLAVAVAVTRDELIFQNPLEALEKHYSGCGRTAEAPEPAEESAPTCPWCGSSDVIAVEWYGSSCVWGPAGTQEYTMQRGYKCRVCERIEED